MQETNKDLLAQSRYFNKAKRPSSLTSCSVTKTKKVPELILTEQELLQIYHEISSISEANPHKVELTRLLKSPIYIQKDREHFEQTLFFAYLYDLYPDIYPLSNAVPNGGHRQKAERYRLFSEGVKSGWPDTQFMIPRSGFSGLFIEFKKPRSLYKTDNAARREVKDHQLQTLKSLNDSGYHARVAFGCSEGISVLKAYLKNELPIDTFYPLSDLR